MKRTSLFTLAFGLSAALAPMLSHAWWNEAWTSRTAVTLNTTAGGVEAKEAANGLVVPVRLHSGNFDFVAAKEDGSDLRVIAADDKTPLPFTIERYDSANELAIVWVAVPAVMPGSDKNRVLVYAGNAAAAAEAPSKVFGDSDALVVHFAEDSGPAIDTSGALKTSADVPRSPGGLIGNAASLMGSAISWPADDRLRIAAGGPVTVSLWARTEQPGQGTLLRYGALRVSLAAGVPTVEIGTAKAAGGSVPPSTWVQLALVANAGKATLYVNGVQSAQVDAALPELSGPLSIGADFVGQIDELQLLRTARSAEWLRLSAAAQGGDAKLIASTMETPEQQESAGDHGYMGILVKNLTVDAWVVIGILGVMFVIAVWVMLSKGVLLVRTDRENSRFLARFRDAAGAQLLQLDQGSAHSSSSLYRLYKAGLRELRKRDVGVVEAPLSGASINAVKASVDADLVRENHKLNAQMVLLTIAISGGPFLGLLGTVVGVMITFAAIAAAGDVNVNAIAPGIAAALLATVAGLSVAIPALFGYNWLASRIKNVSSDMQIFVDEFVTRVAEQYGPR